MPLREGRLESISLVGGDSFISTPNQVFRPDKKCGVTGLQHFKSPSENVVYLEPREALEGTLNSHLEARAYSPCERDTPDGPSPL